MNSRWSVPLLKGVLYQEDNPGLVEFSAEPAGQVRDYVAVLGLELMLDEAEGYAFLRSKPGGEDDEAVSNLPRLVARRQLSFRSACCWRCCARSWPSSTPAAARRA
jgi:hypothetical protein